MVTQPASWYYLTGFTGESGALVVSPGSGTTCSSPTAALPRRPRGNLRRPHRSASRRAVRRVGGRISEGTAGRGKWVLTPGRSPSRSFGDMGKAAGRARDAGKPSPWTTWSAAQPQGPAQELAEMRRAALLADKVMSEAAQMLKPGVRELEVAAEIEYQMRQRGAPPVRRSKPSWLSASAPRYPHARPTAKRLRKNELVVLDLGAILAHYCSDITRTVLVGRAPQRFAGGTKRSGSAGGGHRGGQDRGELRGSGRCGPDVLAEHRLDRYFVHSTGHGLGLGSARGSPGGQGAEASSGAGKRGHHRAGSLRAGRRGNPHRRRRRGARESTPKYSPAFRGISLRSNNRHETQTALETDG